MYIYIYICIYMYIYIYIHIYASRAERLFVFWPPRSLRSIQKEAPSVPRPSTCTALCYTML